MQQVGRAIGDSNGPVTLARPEPSTVRSNLQVLFRRWWVIIVAIVVCTAAALAWSLSQRPVYQGTSTVILDQNATVLSGVPLLTPTQPSILDTMAEVVRSRTVLDRAVASLNFPPDQRRPAIASMRQLQATRSKTSNLLKIQVPGPSPQAAATYTNAITDAFIAWHVESRREPAAAGRIFISDQLNRIGRELHDAEEAVTKYKSATGKISLTDQTSSIVSQLASFEAQLRTAGAERQALEASIAKTRAEIGSLPPLVAAVAQRIEDPVFTTLRNTLTTLEGQMAVLREKYTDEYPAVQALRVQIEDVKRRMAEHAGIITAPAQQATNPIRQHQSGNLVDLMIQRENLIALEAALAGVLNRYERDAATIPPQERDLARLTRNVSVAEGAYLLLAQRLEDTRIAEASIVGDFRVVDRAVPTSTPISPLTLLNTLLGAVAGLVIGLGAAYVLEGLDTTFDTPEEAATALGLPLLATIPVYRVRRGTMRVDKGKIPLADGEHRRSPFAEAFRHLRTSLLYSNPDRPLRSILITSAGPDEGKSTVAANLAVVVTQTEQPVWLLECDLRKPSLIWTFQPRVPLGLSDLLVDGFPLDQALNPTTVGNLWFIAGGTTPPNPAELLGSQKMRTFIEQNVQDTKLLVLDAPPVLPVTDAMVLSRMVDGVVFVLHLTKTPRAAAKRAVEQLETMGVRIVGVVVNAVPRGHRGGYYSYYARYYGGDESEPTRQKERSGSATAD